MGRLHQTLGGCAAVVLALGAFGCADGIDPPDATAVARINGGTFTMGFADGDGCGLFETVDRQARLRTEPRIESARIQHTVEVETFCIDVHEVTVTQYHHCYDRDTCKYPLSTNAGNRGETGFVADYFTNRDEYGDYPVLGVSYEEAIKYCEFRGGVLPTEAQWEYVASSRGTRDRVWDGDDIDLALADGCGGDEQGTVAVGSCTNGVRPVKGSSADLTVDRVYDMAGNAAEWVADDFDYFAYCAQNQPGGLLTDLYQVDGRRPLPIVNAAYVSGEDLVVDGDAYAGGCLERFDACTDRCGVAFGTTAAPDAQQSKWQAYTCGGQQGLSPGEVDQLPASREDCPSDPEDMEVGAVCRALYDCLATPPVAPLRGPECLVDCQRQADVCVVDNAVEGVTTTCTQLESNRNCEIVPWCVPRVGFAAKTIHIRSAAHSSDALADSKTVRGGNFQSSRTCEAFPAWRDFAVQSSPLVGFRCAYPLGSERCPAEE